MYWASAAAKKKSASASATAKSILAMIRPPACGTSRIDRHRRITPPSQPRWLSFDDRGVRGPTSACARSTSAAADSSTASGSFVCVTAARLVGAPDDGESRCSCSICASSTAKQMRAGVCLAAHVLMCHVARGRLREVPPRSGWPGRIACRPSLEPGSPAFPQPRSSPFSRPGAAEPGAATTGTSVRRYYRLHERTIMGEKKMNNFIRQMKLILAVFPIFVAALLVGCGGGGGGSSPPPPCPPVPGVATVNIGSTGGGQYYANLGTGNIGFDNRNLNFSVICAGTVTCSTYIADVGSGCLASITTWPTSGQSAVAMVIGHNYVFDGIGGNHYKFSADAYSQGSVTISWVKM